MTMKVAALRHVDPYPFPLAKLLMHKKQPFALLGCNLIPWAVGNGLFVLVEKTHPLEDPSLTINNPWGLFGLTS